MKTHDWDGLLWKVIRKHLTPETQAFIKDQLDEAFKAGEKKGREDAVEYVERIIDNTTAADGFVGFSEEQWRGIKLFLDTMLSPVIKEARHAVEVSKEV